MSPKSGKAGSAVSPTAPDAAVEAIKADPGAMTKLEAKEATKKAHKPLGQPAGGAGSEAKDGSENPEDELTWIEIELVDEADVPVPGMAYRVELPDGSVSEGVLDDKGLARVEGFLKGSGQCKVTFPSLDQEAWDKA